MDKISIDRIQESHPKIRIKLLTAYNEANNIELGKGVRLRLSYVYRSPEEQDVLFKKRPVVTKATAWQSFHQYGLAFDIVLMYDKDGDGNFEEVSWDTKRDGDKDGIADWLEVTKVFVKHGFVNGFMSKGKKWDLPHFQMDFGYSWQKLKSMIDSKNYTEEIQNGKKIKYVKI
jgi:peptidoglycan L-alanyl-D-glutamate endopeptidase CwlK|tara:strand:+ start:1216 stop:1734 length:519 start_codon:yes stop_codon:yes gene_type:complete